MPCPPGTGCARRADCQDGYCPGRHAATMNIRPGGARIDGPAGTAVHTTDAGRIIPFDHRHPASDTEAAFWLPEAPPEPPAPWAALDAAIDRLLFASPYLWLVVAVLCIASAIGLGLLAGHVSELGPDRVWALLVGAPK